MRAFIIVACCILVVAVVVSVITFAPEPSRENIEVTRIDIDRQPQPVIESDPGAEHILEFFPEPSEPLNLPTPILSENVPEPGEEEAAPPAEPELSNEEMDRNRLLALIDDWVYTDFNQVANRKTGSIRQSRSNMFLSVYEGQQMDNGIRVASLESEAVTLELGESSFVLRRAKEPEFFADVKENLRPLTPEEQKQAYEYYMIVYGEKFKAFSQGYKPPHGMEMPRRVSPEEQQKGLEEYWERYGKQFRRENQEYKTPFQYGEEQREQYEKYWEKYFPDRPKPAFNNLFRNNEAGPGARAQEEAGGTGGSQ